MTKIDDRRWNVDAPRLLTIEETSARLSELLCMPVPVPTLRTWRRTWPAGAKRGPEPRLVLGRLRYTESDCEKFARAALADAGVTP